ncbi:DMT family transporter [Rhizobium sp. KVB221]|uniref:DMT family transporter n=1 Tax=Rhizobium setariae TaxID=2801340 RepID=A0A937CNL6_9HYPH|nr:DMT family transporter [Rhizobium setariae]MBL0372114.1 DMT family transporter [Rhizobium setariae]
MKLERFAPVLFVLLWSSGWISPVYGIGHASAEVFLSVRFALAAVAFAIFSVASGARWPKDPKFIAHGFVSGLLLHGAYLGGVWWAIFNGVPASVSGVIAALQPLMTGALAPWLVGEKLSGTQLMGLVLGFLGILTALVPSFEGVDAAVFAERAFPIAVNIVAMSGAVLGTLYQKRFIHGGDMRTTAVYQYIGAFSVVFALTFVTEEPKFDFSLQLMLVMAWSVFALSMGAVALLLYMIRRGQVSRAASLIYLMPPTVAIESYIFLGEPLGFWMIAGTVIVVAGVWLAGRKPKTLQAAPSTAS